MTMFELLEMSWSILEFTVTRGPLICLVIFMLVMVKTLLDISRKLTKMAAPGIRKMMPTSRKK